MPGLTTGGQGYAFNYDNVNRFTQSSYYTQSGSTFTQSASNALTEKINGYDEMGNIDTLQRRDKNGSLVNNLTYTYNYQSTGNQLQSVSDGGSQNITGTYTYDGNGNMTADSRKNITITYNYLDLPDTVKQGTNRLVFTYDAAGHKLYKQLLNGSTVVSQRHYVEDEELTATTAISYDGKIESIAMDEGRIVNTGSNVYQYEYYMQDHLYTNRVTFRPNSDGTLNLATVQNYYPFGGNMGDATMNYSASPQNLHLYEGKETQPELNLNTYDFGARHYDPVLGRWMAIDPLAEESEDMSPYNYVENNPMNLMDPDGMQPLGDAMPPGMLPDGATVTATRVHSGGTVAGNTSSGSNALTYGTALLSAGLQFYEANKAFGWSVHTLNWNSSHLQQNVSRINLNQNTNYGLNSGTDKLLNEGDIALSYVDKDRRPYSMTDKKGTIDCSRFTREVAKKAGYDIPRTAYEQAKWYQRHGFWSSELGDAKSGDHVFWVRGPNQYHTGIIYINGSMSAIQANVNHHKSPSIHKFHVRADGTQRGFNQPFAGVGRSNK